MEQETLDKPVQEETVKAKNFFARLGGVFFSPREAFTEISRAPRILIPILAVFLVGGISAQSVSIKVAPSAQIKAQIGGLAEMIPEEQLAAMDKQPSVPGRIFSAISSGISMLILCVIVAAYGRIFSMITGSENQYKSLLEVSIYVWTAITIVSTVLTAIVLQIKAPGTAMVQEMPDIASSLGSWIEGIAGTDVLPKFIMGLAKAVDIFAIWMIALLAIGFSAVSKKLKTSTAAMWLGGIYAIFALLGAAVSSAFGA
jgi:hypothetical protein